MVASTPTALDALADRKRILEENALLIQQGDTARRDTLLWQDALAAVKAELKALGGASLTEAQIGDIVATQLAQKKENLHKDIEALDLKKGIKNTAVAELNAIQDALTLSVDAKKKEAIEFQGIIDLERAAFNVERKQNADAVDRSREERASEEGKLAQVRQTVLNEQAGLEARERAVLEDEKRLAIKGRDLAIYESRIRKEGQKVGIEIIL